MRRALTLAMILCLGLLAAGCPRPAPVADVPPTPTVDPVPAPSPPPVDAGDELPPGEPYDSYVTITDDTSSISVSVPTAWADVDGTSPTAEPALTAAPDLGAYQGTWDVPGVTIVVTRDHDADPEGVLDRLAADACPDVEREDYDDGVHSGRVEYAAGCGGTDTVLVTIAAMPDDLGFMAVVRVQVVTDADVEAAGVIVSSWIIAR